MMKNILWLLLAFALGMTACSDSDSVLSESDEACFILRLSFGDDDGTHFTRASGNPTGGETGDGLEAGLHHENDIDNLCLFRYNAGFDGINGDADVVVTKMAYITGIDFHPTSDVFHREKITKDVPLTDVEYEYTDKDQFIVVVNMGNIMGSVTTLGALRDHLVETLYNPGTHHADYVEFAMTNADESYYTAGDGTVLNPRTIHVNLERITARIDFAIDGSTVRGDKRAYGVHGTSGSTVLLSHVRAFNVMQQPTYLLKRLAAAPSAQPHYLADEECPATQYVVEPYTWAKTLAGKTPANLSQWYGDTRLPQLAADVPAWFTDADRIHTGAGSAFTDGVTYDPLFNNTFYVMTYAGENTARVEECDGAVTTGIKLRAIYVPGVVYTFDGTALQPYDGYAEGDTFWRYQPVTGQNDYDDSKNLYFLTQADAEAYRHAHPEQIAKVAEYPEAVCYYTAWLRHDRQYNTVGETLGKNVMEFGIVRNNIYRLQVEFSGPGSPDPLVPEDPESIRTYIYVKKWNLIVHPAIEI